MLSVGLTGGIGAGKSAVAKRLVANGAELIDSDVLAREVVSPGSAGLELVVEAFGQQVLDVNGRLDRSALAREIFEEPKARERLESIIHPLVRERTAVLLSRAPADAIVVNDVPLLAEVGLAPTFDLVIVVTAPHDARLQRLEARGLPRDEALARIATQADDTVRLAIADAVIDNSGNLERLHEGVDELWRSRLVQFEIAKRNGVASVEPSAIGDTEPQWADRFDRVAARLRYVLDGQVERVDHIGATAVSQLPADDTIDVQVTVRHSADRHEVHSRLIDAGYRMAGSSTSMSLSADTDEVPLLGADPGNPLRVHVRSVDTADHRLPNRVAGLLAENRCHRRPGLRESGF